MSQPQKLHGLRLLLADDSPDLCKLCQMTLESFGATVETAPDGAAAVQLFEDELRAGRHFDLILLDYEMPHLNGAEAARLIHETEPRLPIVCFTGDSVISEVEAGIPIWPKPMGQTELIAHIEQLLAQ